MHFHPLAASTGSHATTKPRFSRTLAAWLLLAISLLSVHGNAAAFVSDGLGKLVNISTRANVLVGDNVLIAGFIITGGTKRVLVRADGQSLASAGLAGVMANPMLSLYSGASLLASNDNWGSSADAATISASGYAPTNANEPAIVATLNPGAYTAIVSGVGSSTGIALVSVTDLDALTSPSRLANISSRAYTTTGGDTQVIAGFIIAGGSHQVLLRGAGPALSALGVAGAASDPLITLYSGSTSLDSNDDWGSSGNAGTIGTLTNSSLTTKESAIYTDLAAGAYTVIMRSNSAAGVALVSVDEQAQPVSAATGIAALYGQLTLNYKLSCIFCTNTFTDTVAFSAADLKTDGSVSKFISYVSASSNRNISCSYSPAASVGNSYKCIIVDTSGTTELYLFDLLNGQIANGIYTYCGVSLTPTQCASKSSSSPSGTVSGAVVHTSSASRAVFNNVHSGEDAASKSIQDASMSAVSTQ